MLVEGGAPAPHERVVPLAPQLLAVLQAVEKKAGLVSTTRRGQPWAECSLNHALKQAMKKVGIVAPFRFHDLGHFFVTQLFRRGGGAPAVQALAGHLHLSTTRIYAHIVREDLVATIGLLSGDGNGLSGHSLRRSSQRAKYSMISWWWVDRDSNL